MLRLTALCKLEIARSPQTFSVQRRAPADKTHLLHGWPVIASMLGVLLTKWTVRLALACYVAYLAGWLSPYGARWPRAARAIWTLGCVLFVVHVACAFHFHHQCSHAVAWQHTAERTRQLLGVAVGDGIYFSYLFLVLWVLDVVWLWFSPLTNNRLANGTPVGSPTNPATAGATSMPWGGAGTQGTPMWRVMVHLFLLFVAVNGAIVFEAGPTRWAGLATGLALGCLAVRRGYNSFQFRKTKFSRETVHESAASSRA